MYGPRRRQKVDRRVREDGVETVDTETGGEDNVSVSTKKVFNTYTCM